MELSLRHDLAWNRLVGRRHSLHRLQRRLVWDIAHDVMNGGGAPALDFAVFCPLALAMGISLILRSVGRHPFEGFGFVVYGCLVAIFGFVLWLFDRLGEPERQRQLLVIKQTYPQKLRSRKRRPKKLR